jgi:isocitrate dehydrogenase
MSDKAKILYTLTDEAPALATRSLLPILQAFTQSAGVQMETRDISLAARILAVFPDHLTEEQQVPDALAELGDMAQNPAANIVKLPNISASLPQLKAAIQELQEQGYPVPSYPENPTTAAEKQAKERYDKVKGSAVNPVLREGNSDRRAPQAVKAFARKHPHRMGAWDAASKSHVAHMEQGDFYGSEQSLTLEKASTVRIELLDEDGQTTLLKPALALEKGEVIDGAFMSQKALRQFLAQEMKNAREQGILFSLHLKATMMKVSDPIIFGHAVATFCPEVYETHAATLQKWGVSPNNGLGELVSALEKAPAQEHKPVEAALEKALQEGPDLAMVNSHKGITNLHYPNDIIIDASMPAMIRSSGQMWNKNDETQDAKAVIPDRSYAPLYQETIAFHQENGAFDPATMGSVANVGLMAQKAEEYGSHDKTFEIPAAGIVRVVSSEEEVLMQHHVEKGDIWRLCQTKDAPIRDWVGLAVRRARATGLPAVFWLDKDRAHDRELIQKVKTYLPEHDTEGLELPIMRVEEATRYTLERTRQGKDTISVTGNVLRDYLTDLFPILEVGTSAKMLSIVPLMNGGGLFETGAGGSAPKHVQQFVEEGHLRWDSLGEFLALTASLEHLAATFDRPRARVLATTLDAAISRYLEEGKGPSRKVKEIDNRGSHFYLALYWAQALAQQKEDAPLREVFTSFHPLMEAQADRIAQELMDAQGSPQELGGYYFPSEEKVRRAMRPSITFNKLLQDLQARLD